MSDRWVCGTRSYCGDDVHGACARCGRAIVWRPWANQEAEKVCIGCVLTSREPVIEIPQRAVDEFRLRRTATGR